MLPFLALPRLSGWLVVALVLIVLIALISPTQLPVVLYKLSLVTFATVLAYWLDRTLFYYARPHQLFAEANGLHKDSQFYDSNQLRLQASLATLRRALIVLAVVLGMTLGL
ncbi:putative phage-like membrane protein [Methylophaga frappieri]|uniref:Putative phage-like membrane protein n=1 Tax=Methylophaga frappieri (strain ATCC BAA-2434 / DSM 25690 / JAM7) TaxID=754477 RepID=I1YGE9_METFJ|nr:putative holin [Methylophaga frappieri]AFJ01992.1 putative phage-like membrane protein [Methylophaga frappieri]